MTELRRFHEPGAETAPDYIKRGVSGLWRGDVILIEDANGNVLGLSQPDVEANHCVFYGQNSSAGVSAGGCPWYEFKIRHEVRKGMLAGKNMIFWYDQDMKCMKKWPRHRWCRILNAEVEIMEAGLLNPEKEWGPVIGRGGHGRVVRSAVAFDGSKVAIKIVRIVEGKKDVSERRFFEQEARLLYTLENDYLISCYATFVIENDDDTYLHLVMELAEETLEAYIDNLRYNLRFLEENEVWQIFIEILLGLHFLHTNEHRILHRDISLCNILRVLQKGEDGKPDRFIHKLSDLGVARVRREQTESTRSSYYGKVRNFAPEQHQGRSHTEKTDIFQLGLVVHYCCNLKHPHSNQFEKSWKNRVIERISSRYSDELDKVITSCLSLSPDSRPNTVELLANPILRKKAEELGFNLPDPVAIVGLIKLDFDKEEIAVFNKGKLRLEYPPRYFMPATFRKAFGFSPVEMDEDVKFGDSSYILHVNMSSMFIQFKCVCVSNTHDWHLQLTLRHLSSIVDFDSIDGHWWSPINIYLNERIVSWKFQPEYWRDYCESVFELESDLVNWDGTVNVVKIQLSEDATTKYWLQGCKLEIQRKILDVEDYKVIKHEDVKGEFIWVVTRSLCFIMAITYFLSLCAYRYLS
ncbi:hypothetical protein M758_2G081600 [Ceratodon purpureus]|nr:hypothetical protein M758_2G081600 [Ceratodon purpureus]